MKANSFIRNFTFFTAIGILIFIIFQSAAISDTGQNDSYLPNTVVIKFNNSPGLNKDVIKGNQSELNIMLAENNIESLKPLISPLQLKKIRDHSSELSRIYIASYSGDESPLEKATTLNLSPLIEYSEPKYIHYTTTRPNDALYDIQRAYYEIIQAPYAWDVVRGENSDIIVAVVDAGIDIHHPDLVHNIWANDQEVYGTPGIDDDGRLDSAIYL